MKKYYKYIFILSLVLGVFSFGSSKIDASKSDTITYANSSISEINNAKNTITITTSDDSNEVINKVPISVRIELRNAKATASSKLRYTINVSDSNNFVSISKAPNHKDFIDKAMTHLSKKPTAEENEQSHWLVFTILCVGGFALIITRIKIGGH